jgi:hypothetical protein
MTITSRKAAECDGISAPRINNRDLEDGIIW